MRFEDQKDIECVLAAQDGEKRAFSEIVKRHHKAVRAYLLVRLNNVHDSEDLAQEVFLTAYRQISRFDTTRQMGPWLRGIAFNLLRNFYSKKKAVAVGGNNELESIIQAEIEHHHKDNREAEHFSALMECVEELQKEDREMVENRYMHQQTIHELCEAFHKKHSAVTMRLHRLRQLLIACAEGKLSHSRFVK